MADIRVPVNTYVENWVERTFEYGPLDGTKEKLPELKYKRTFYDYNRQEFEGEMVDRVEYVYRLVNDKFLLTEKNGIIKKYK